MQERSLNDNFLSNLKALNNGENSKRIEFLLYDVLKLDMEPFKQGNKTSIMESLLDIQEENEEYDPETGYDYINLNDEGNKLNPPIENIPRFIYKFKDRHVNLHEEPLYSMRVKQNNLPERLTPDYHDELTALFTHETKQESDYDSDSDSDSDHESIPLLFMIFHTSSAPKMSNPKTQKRKRNKLKAV